MKVSLNWVKQYLDFELPATDELIQKIGEQLGAVEEIIELGPKYAGVVVARVVSVVDHPDADRLHICTIDDGGKIDGVERDDQGYVQVVCGAPNVREGLAVAWLPPGATVPESFDTDPFVLEARKLRGVLSNGMLASKRELALGDDHDGILEIDEEITAGQSFAELFDLNDTIIDIENKMFTHRPDCFGQLGVAREIAGILGHSFKSPEWYAAAPTFSAGQGLELTVDNQLTASVPHFLAVALKDVQITTSPVRIQTFLARVGVKAINNVVDITNYIMLLTGQPIHAYDYDKVAGLTDAKGAALVVRYPVKGEQILLLNGKTIEPRDEAIMIATDKQLIGVGGIMGGHDTEVDSETKNIILEVATFDMYSIRRTSMAHGLFTDAVTRNNKGQSPLQVPQIAERTLRLLHDVTGGVVASRVIDQQHPAIETDRHVSTDASFINQRLGTELAADEIATLLRNVEVATKAHSDGRLDVTVPFWRTDLELAEDIVEEVGRLYGFGRLPETLPLRSVAPVSHNPVLRQKQWIREILPASGANEVLTYSFVHGDLLEKAGQNKAAAFSLSNALSPDLQYYRLSLTPSLLDKVHLNIKAGHASFALFEIGKIHEIGYSEADGLPAEQDVVALVFAADQKAAKAYEGAAYYQARAFAEQLLKGQSITFAPLYEYAKGIETPPAQLAPFAPERSAVLLDAGELIGVVGEYRTAVVKGFKLPPYSAGLEIELGSIGTHRVSTYRPLPKFPRVEQDITLKVSTDVAHAVVYEALAASLDEHAIHDTRSTLSLRDIYQPEGADYRHVSFRIGVASYVQTLTDKQVSALLDRVASDLAAIKAERI